jgi:LuxR family transcriptional regulator, activator of tox operons
VQSYVVPPGRHALTVIGSPAAPLIESVGQARFPSLLFRAAHEAIGCIHINAFSFAGNGAPAIIFAENDGPAAVARQIGDRYVERYWRMDPINDANIPPDGRHMIEIGVNDIPYADYRFDCYTTAKLGARISICEARNGRAIRVNFYRDSEFSTAQKSALVETMDLLMPLLWRHAGGLSGRSAEGELTDFQSRLARIAPALSPREREVCALIAAGYSSEAISLRLGVSLNTVLTFRKRAYRRLLISSQNELLRLLMDG